MSSAAASMTLSPKVASRPSPRVCLKAVAMLVRPKVVSQRSLRTSSAVVPSMIVTTMHEKGGFQASTFDYPGGDLIIPLTQPAGQLDRATTNADLLELGIPSSSYDFLIIYNGQHEQGGFPASTSDYPSGDFTLKRPLTQPAGHLDRATTNADLLLELGIPPSSSVFHVQDGFTPRISRPLSPQVTPLVVWGSSAHQCRLRTFPSLRSVIVRAASMDSAPTPPSNPPDGARSLLQTVLKWIVKTSPTFVAFKPIPGSGLVDLGASFGVFIILNGYLYLGTDKLMYISWVVSLLVATISVVMEWNVDGMKAKDEQQRLKAENEGLRGMLEQLMSKVDGIATSLDNMQNGGITGVSPQA